MASSINASTSGAGGVITTADNTGILNLQTASTTAVTVDASQNVGIGTTSPSYKLSLQTALTGTTAGSNTLGSFYSNGSGYDSNIRFGDNTNSATMLGYLSGNMYMYTGGAERMRLDTSGNLLIGTTSSAAKLNVTSSTATSASKVIQFNNSAGTELLAIQSDGSFFTGSAASSPNNLTTAAGANVVIASFGLLYRSTSALKYKQDIRDLEYIDINKFRPVRYKSKCKNDDKNKDYIGFIADEVDAIGLKELVSYGDNGEVEGFQYERMTAILCKALQEQQTIINDLKARVTALEAK